MIILQRQLHHVIRRYATIIQAVSHPAKKLIQSVQISPEC